MGSDVRTVDLWPALSGLWWRTDAAGLDLVPRPFEHFLETQTHGGHVPELHRRRARAARSGDSRGSRRASHRATPCSSTSASCTARVWARGTRASGWPSSMWFFAPSEFPDVYIPILA